MKKIRLRNFSVQAKLCLILATALALTAAGVLGASQLPYRAYDEQLYQRSAQLLVLFSQAVNTELEKIADQSLQMLGDTVLQGLLIEMNGMLSGTERWLTVQKGVRERIAYFGYLNKDYQAVQLLRADGQVTSQVFGRVQVRRENFDECLEKARAAEGREVWLAGVVPQGSLLLARDIRQISELKLDSLALLMITVDLHAIVQRCNQSMAELGLPLRVGMYLDGEQVYATDEALTALIPPADGYRRVQAEGENQLLVRKSSQDGRWTYLTMVSYDAISRSARDAMENALLLTAGILTAALLLAFLLIRSIMRHFEALQQKFQAFAEGRYSFMGPEDPYRRRGDELGRLHCQFDVMARENKRMIEENWEKQQLLLEAQVRQLRGQIQPHFLFNTLASIACLAEGCQDARIARMTTSLARMLRKSLSDKREVISLREDLQIAEEYMSIQLIRYGDRLEMERRVPEELLETPVPAMTVQPLVENAVRHAAEEMLEPCRIAVTARRNEGRVEICVEDNGPGMPEDMLEKLERGEAAPSGLGIGLRNIDRRLKLLFSAECGLRIQRAQGVTRVIVLLPGKEEKP